MRETALGIDIGGTFTKFGLTDVEGNVMMEGSIPTYTHKEIEPFLDSLSEAINQKLDEISEPIEINIVNTKVILNQPQTPTPPQKGNPSPWHFPLSPLLVR